MRLLCLGTIVGASVLAAGCATAPRSAPPPPPAAPAAPVVPLPTLIEWLSSPDPAVRAQAAWSLYRARGAEAEVLPALRRLEEDDTRDVRYAARWSIGHLERPEGTGCCQPGPLEDDLTPPRLVERAYPSYPDAAFRRGIHGTVETEILIGEEGEVAYAVVKRSIPALDQAALACVRRFRFEPARRHGKPIAILAESPVMFGLQ